MLSALTVIHNFGFIQCVRSLLDDRNVDTNIVLFMEDPYDFNVPVISIGLDNFKKSILFKSLDEKRMTTNSHVFSSAHEDMSWKNMKNFAQLKKDTIFANLSSGDISVGIFKKYEIQQNLLGSCENRTNLNESITTWLKNRKKWKYPKSNVCYTFDPPFTMNHSSESRKGMVLDIHEMIHEKIGIKPVFRKVTLLDQSKRKSPEKRLQIMMNSRRCDYFLQGTMGHMENKFDFTTPSFSDTLFWYTPTAKLVPKWKYVYQILSKSVWFFWISTLFSLVVFWHLSTIALGRFAHEDSLFCRLWAAFRLAIEQDFSSRPSNITEVIIISALILESFIMNVAYKCKFIQFLSDDNYENELNSLADIMEHDLKIGFLPLLTDLFAHDEKMNEYLTDHYVFCDFSFTCIDRTANLKDMVVLRAKTKLSYNAKRYLDSHGKFKLKKIGGVVSAMTFNSIFRRGHPLYPVVEKELLNLLAHGFVQKVYKDYVKFNDVAEENAPTNLTFTLKHLRLSFLILFVGWVEGGILFFSEILYYRYFQGSFH